MRTFLLWLAAVTALTLSFTGPASGAVAGSAVFRAGTIWHGQFASPSIIEVGHTYWAFGTATGGDNIPSEHSTNLHTWRTHAAYPAGANPGWWKGYNDALPHPASWALYDIHRNGHRFASVWAPSVAEVGGRFVMAYAVGQGRVGRHCISVATSTKVSGPYVDRSSKPLVCSSDPMGSIDPQLFRPGGGRTYLLWKNAGVKGSTPTEIFSRPLDAAGTGFAAHSRAHFLLATHRRWEGNVIENPAMIHYGARYFLFYSGNSYTTTKYATGYAICAGPVGPCRRPSSVTKPLLATNRQTAGPGGATPFVGPSGALRLAYAAWDTAHSKPGDAVRLHIARLTVDRRGLLHVASRG
ncbi:glycoside hydrolase family 43 protein [Jatrophihabitans endophyticus]|uniref:glycoside hydrolase family 43 protein n=1 Tax=Jatrophihabitans endophyticus TaxID=1206085 RepID=UPI001A0A69E5|nr:glycoside hydrolase family 43 protein [Jatrophihabitans endophyticus]MBE7189584.1 family 43 glycosylhydrolase [Jatrophihabitans endophyticus]